MFQAAALDGFRGTAYNQSTIETRGDLPPLAATLNKELKSDSPGGAARPAFLLSVIATRARSPMPIASHLSTIRRRGPLRGDTAAPGAKRIAGTDTGRMSMCIGRIRGCRPGTTARPGEQRD
jgi:hypothetical protein